MTSLPIVHPGDMVFWHCDVVHSVEREHTGKEDSVGTCTFSPITLLYELPIRGCHTVMYIPAVPLTPQNARYIARQKERFVTGAVPPDFEGGPGEGAFSGRGQDQDVIGEVARKAMGLAYRHSN